MRSVIVSLLTLSIIMGIFIAWIAFAPNTPQLSDEKSLYIPRESSFEDVVDSLISQEVLDRIWSFRVLAFATGWDHQVKAGHYVFSSPQSNLQLLQTLRKGLQTTVVLRIPEGSRRHRVARVAAYNMAFEPEDFLQALQDTSLAASLDTDTLHLFSYMLPETYHFYWLTDARDVVSRIKREFDAFYERELSNDANARNMTPQEVLSLAAIVEWETNLDSEKNTIAGVYLNRLRKNWPLQADPTIQFALIELEGNVRRLFFRDYQIQHPYNTYLYQGLPPGPITNPSPVTLRATAAAEDHTYMFFVASPNGGHTFNTNLRGHHRDAAKWRRYMAERRRQRSSDMP